MPSSLRVLVDHAKSVTPFKQLRTLCACNHGATLPSRIHDVMNFGHWTVNVAPRGPRWIGHDLDRSASRFHDFLDHGEAHAGAAARLVRLQRAKGQEYGGMLVARDARPIVADRDDEVAGFSPQCSRIVPVRPVVMLDRILNEVS